MAKNALPSDGSVAAGVIDSVPAGEGLTVVKPEIVKPEIGKPEIGASVEIGTSADFISGGTGGTLGRAATSVWDKTEVRDETEVVAEAALAPDAEAGAVDSEAAEAEVGVESEAGAPRSSSPRAKADDPKNTNSMAATATLTSFPLT